MSELKTNRNKVNNSSLKTMLTTAEKSVVNFPSKNELVEKKEIIDFGRSKLLCLFLGNNPPKALSQSFLRCTLKELERLNTESKTLESSIVSFDKVLLLIRR